MERVAAVILAGGEGRRMGGAKPLRRLGATTLLGRAQDLARRWSPLVAVAVRDADQAGDTATAPLILDDPATPGPMAGLVSAFAFARREGADRLLVLPCDAPNLPADLLDRLAAGLWAGVAAAVASSGGRLHPTCALWRLEAEAHLSGYLARGGASLRGFADLCGMAVIDWPTTGGDPFANANTPEDLAALQSPPGS